MAVQQLQLTVDKQGRKLAKYEKKLIDVVSAYKVLLAEKDALEKSFNALDTTSCSDEVQTLQSSLATLNKEKGKRESAWTADKRALLDEMGVVRAQMRAGKTEAERQKNAFDLNISEAQTLLRAKQAEHDFEKNQWSAKLSEYIGRCASLEKAAEGEEVHKECRRQLTETRGQLNDALTQAENSATVLLIHEQMHEMKQRHEGALEFERRRCAVLEEARLCEQSDGSAARRCKELVDSITIMQRDAQQHTATVLHMNDRIAALEGEKARLGERSTPPPSPTRTQLMKQMVEATRLLHKEHGVEHRAIIKECKLTEGDKEGHAKCNDRLREVETELDDMRRANEKMVRAASSALDDMTATTSKAHGEEVNALLAQVHLLSTERDDVRREGTARESAMQREHRAAMEALQGEIIAQRDRSVQMLSECQQELGTTQAILANAMFDTDELHRVQRQLGESKEEGRCLTQRLCDVEHELCSANLLHEASLDVMKKEIRHVRSELAVCSGDPATMQYLRNVLLQYLGTPAQSTARRDMLKAIGQVLKFTVHEVAIIDKAEGGKGYFGFK